MTAHAAYFILGACAGVTFCLAWMIFDNWWAWRVERPTRKAGKLSALTVHQDSTDLFSTIRALQDMATREAAADAALFDRSYQEAMQKAQRRDE